MERVEKYTKMYQDGEELKPPTYIPWRTVPRKSRTIEEQAAANDYFIRVFKRVNGFSYMIVYFSAGVTVANSFDIDLLTMYCLLIGGVLFIFGIAIDAYLYKRKHNLARITRIKRRIQNEKN